MLNNKKKGFTLIELIVVIAILGILAAVLIPRFAGFTEKARSSQVMVNAKQIATAADAYIAEHNATPSAADITSIAGADITATEITGISMSGDHAGFTYQHTVSGTTFTATRSATSGAINITW